MNHSLTVLKYREISGETLSLRPKDKKGAKARVLQGAGLEASSSYAQKQKNTNVLAQRKKINKSLLKPLKD